MTLELDGCVLAHLADVVEGAISVGGHGGGEHVHAVPGKVMPVRRRRGQRVAVRVAAGSRQGQGFPTSTDNGCSKSSEFKSKMGRYLPHVTMVPITDKYIRLYLTL